MFVWLKGKVEEEPKDPFKWLCLHHGGKVREEREARGKKIVCKDVLISVKPKEFNWAVREAWKYHDEPVEAEYRMRWGMLSVFLNKRPDVDFCSERSGSLELVMGAEFEGDEEEIVDIEDKIYDYIDKMVENYRGLGWLNVTGHCLSNGKCYVYVRAGMPIKYFESFDDFLGTVEYAAESAFDEVLGGRGYRYVNFEEEI